MSSEMVIRSNPKEVDIAFFKDKELVELHKEKRNKNFAVGDLMMGRVSKIVPGLNAAFVDVGYSKDAFLHYLDMGPQYRSLNKYVLSSLNKKRNNSSLEGFKLEKDIDKHGKINDILKEKHKVMVQITKEPISTKGPRLCCELSLAGRYSVLVPFTNKISISQKIGDAKERERLNRLIESIRPPNFGVIVRTAATNRKVVDLNNDVQDLVDKWEKAFQAMRGGKAPKKVLGEIDRAAALLRDVLNPSFTSIQVDDPKMYEDIRNYLSSIGSDKEQIVHLYEKEKGQKNIFEHFGINKKIKALFGKTVTMRSGAYLVIEHTEALHVIDVNSGPRSKSDKDQETNAFEVNMESAAEVARQLRLRDMGGIIVIDFIDLHKAEYKKQLLKTFQDEMKLDRAKHKILPLSRFGLMQITRQRVRPEMNITTAETCASCRGTGQSAPSILLTDEIENKIRLATMESKPKGLIVYTHPYLESYINRGMWSNMRKKWMTKYGTKIQVKPTEDYQMLEYRIFNDKGEEVE